MLNKLLRHNFSTAVLDSKKQRIYDSIKNQTNLLISRDDYQVNVSLIIERKPIFLHMDEFEMKKRKMRFSINKKYNLLPNIPKELLEFQHRPPNQYPQSADETPTHMHFDDRTSTRTYYLANSKHFSFVDANITDPQSIQSFGCQFVYLMLKQNGEDHWNFPTKAVLDNQTFADARQELFQQLSQNEWKLIPKSQLPYACHRIDFPDNQDLRVKGTKTFYFLASHLEGEIKLFNQYSGQHNWVPRAYMNKYLSRDEYNSLIPVFTA